jgi:hypothetical protein
MMKKKINKKLTLVKQTITNLNENGMTNAKGGVNPSNNYCTTQTIPQVGPADLSEANGTRCWEGTLYCIF